MSTGMSQRLGAKGLIRRFNPANDGVAKIPSDYFLIRIER
jgi:hypothetical protein